MTLQRTALYENHLAAGAKMVDFGGFEMPLKYTSETDEHLAVRQGAGVFDVSHMGEVVVEGNDALLVLQRLVTKDAARLADGQAMYAGLLNERGGFVDDVVVYRFSATRFLVCVNAANRTKDFSWMRGVVAALTLAEPSLQCVVRDESAQWSQLAVQGPRAVDIVARLCGEQVRDIKKYWFMVGRVGDDGDAIIARTGYTGEDGFELYVRNEHVGAVWDAVRAGGAVACGLACRDTLRLEAGMCLYGNDIDDDVTPLEANLGWTVDLDGRPAFIGHRALVAQKAAGPERLLRGLVMIERGIARQGYDVVDDHGDLIGVVTSGTQAPHEKKAIAFALLKRTQAAPGTTVSVLVRGKPVKATVVKLPFYKRPS